MEEYFIKGGQFILSLSILIVLHELGHFIPAKLFKTKVEKFYLFFDPWFSLFKIKKGETEYGIGWLPLGGYVKISGMIDESMDKEQMKKPAEPWEFRAKPTWQRLIIMVGGVVVNFILAFLIYIIVAFAWGEDVLPIENVESGLTVHDEFKKFGFKDGDLILALDGEDVEDVLDINKHIFLRGKRMADVIHADESIETITLPEDIDRTMFKTDAIQAFMPRIYSVLDSVLADENAEKAGFLKGDSIVSINGNTISFWDEVIANIKPNKGELINIGLYRNNNYQEIGVPVDSAGTIGISPKIHSNTVHVDYSFGESISEGISKGYWTLAEYIGQLKFLFTKKGAGSIGGFGAIASIFPAEWSWVAFWKLTALLSIILGFMNILPIPALDGGHVMFLLYEMIAGKPPGEKFLERAQMVGMVLLLGLLLYANGNDIYKAIFG